MRKYRIIAVVLCVFLLAGCANSADSSGTAENNGETTAMSIVIPPPAPKASSSRPTCSVTTTVTLADENIKIDGAGVNASGTTLTVTEDGVYKISCTLSDGQIIINAPDNAVVELVLSGVNISSSKNSAIYCKNCDDFIITLTENTQNVLSDAKSYTYDNTAEQEPNAALFSKTDMNIGGSGWLIVNANFNHGISSKDDLVIEGGGYTVTAAVDAIRGKDSLVILDGKFELNAGGDGLQASSMGCAELGYAQLVDAEYTIKSGGDTVDSNGNIYVTGSTLRLSSPPYPDYEGSLSCNGDVTISRGNMAAFN